MCHQGKKIRSHKKTKKGRSKLEMWYSDKSKTAAPSHAFNDTRVSDQYRKPSMLF